MSERDLIRTVPLLKAVNAAIIDMHEDCGRCQETFSHWATRVFKKLNRQSLRMGMRRVLLHINHNTHTAILPMDFHEETFVGPIVDGKKVPLPLRSNLVDLENVEEIDNDGECQVCGQDRSICNDLTITQEQELVSIGDQTALKTIVKKLYPSGDYFLEITYPVLNIGNSIIEYQTVKEFITHLDMKGCGCPELNDETVKKIECFCPDAFCKHFTPCAEACKTNHDYGGYEIFEDIGVIKFDGHRHFDKVYMEYRGYLPKRNGQYHIPEVAFEAVIEGTKYKFVQNKKNIPKWERDDQFAAFRRECDNMHIELTRIPLSVIMEAVTLIPKFDLHIPFRDTCFTGKFSHSKPVCEQTLCAPQSTTIPTAAMFGGGVDRVDWTTTGLEGGVLTHIKLQGKRLLYFNIETNDTWQIIFPPNLPNEQQILFNSIDGTITLKFPFDAGLRAYAIFAPQL